jgi:hypothetical protein
MTVSVSPIERLERDPYSPIGVRDFRRMVQQTASLVSTNGRIAERMGSGWAAELESRTIIWRTTSPWPPFEVISEDEMLVLIAHEAGHLVYSGKYDVPGVKPEEAPRFHRFVNACEDIRIERLLGKEFGGFWSRSKAFAVKCGGHLETTTPGLHPSDQVALSLCLIEKGAKPVGLDVWQKFARKHWATIDTAVATSNDTAELARAIYPVWRLLETEHATQQQPEEQPDGGGQSGEESDDEQQGGESGDEQQAAGPEGRPGSTGSSAGDGEEQPGEQGDGESSEQDDGEEQGDDDGEEQGEGSGSGSESGDIDEKQAPDRPARSEGTESTPISPREQLEGMREDAIDPNAAADIDEMIGDDEVAEAVANSQAEQVQGGDNRTTRAAGKKGRGSWDTTSASDAWMIRANQLRGPINSLASRLRAVLRTNASDNWQRGKKRGRLDSAKAYRASAGNPRIFKSREAVGDLDYTVGIGVDCSGSMKQADGRKAKSAYDATVIVAEALEKVGLTSIIVPWETTVGFIKPAHEKLANHRGPLGSQLRASAGGTTEVCGLIVLQEQMRGVTSGHKLVFMITDGETSRIDESQALIAEMEREGVIMVGIGIGGFQPHRHYKNRVKVDTVEELGVVLPRLINDFVKRGHSS